MAKGNETEPGTVSVDYEQIQQAVSGKAGLFGEIDFQAASYDPEWLTSTFISSVGQVLTDLATQWEGIVEQVNSYGEGQTETDDVPEPEVEELEEETEGDVAEEATGEETDADAAASSVNPENEEDVEGAEQVEEAKAEVEQVGEGEAEVEATEQAAEVKQGVQTPLGTGGPTEVDGAEMSEPSSDNAGGDKSGDNSQVLPTSPEENNTHMESLEDDKPSTTAGDPQLTPEQMETLRTSAEKIGKGINGIRGAFTTLKDRVVEQWNSIKQQARVTPGTSNTQTGTQTPSTQAEPEEVLSAEEPAQAAPEEKPVVEQQAPAQEPVQAPAQEPAAPVESAPPKAEPAKEVISGQIHTDSGANLRIHNEADISASSRTGQSIKSGTDVTITGRQGDMYYVETSDGQQGWVAASKVNVDNPSSIPVIDNTHSQVAPSSQGTSQPQSSGNVKTRETTVQTQSTRLNVRAGAGTDSEIVGKLEKGSSIEIIGEPDENGWVKVLYEGQERYVSSKYLAEFQDQGGDK